MNKKEIESFIKSLLSEIADEEVADNEASLFEMGILDSVSVLYLVTELEEMYNVEIALKDINEENFKNVNKLVSYLDGILKLED